MVCCVGVVGGEFLVVVGVVVGIWCVIGMIRNVDWVWYLVDEVG